MTMNVCPSRHEVPHTSKPTLRNAACARPFHSSVCRYRPPEPAHLEQPSNDRLQRVRTVAQRPAAPLADADPDLRLVPSTVDVVVHDVPDVPPRLVLDRERSARHIREPVVERPIALVALVRRLHRPRSVELRQVRVAAPAELVRRISHPLSTDHGPPPARDDIVRGKRSHGLFFSRKALAFSAISTSFLKVSFFRATSAGNHSTLSYSISCFEVSPPTASIR